MFELFKKEEEARYLAMAERLEKLEEQVNCGPEKLCTHKKQLLSLWEQLKVEERLLEARLRLPGRNEENKE